MYEYAIARSIGAYIPYVFDPIIYLAILTIVASTDTAIRSSNTVLEIPLSNIHCVNADLTTYSSLYFVRVRVVDIKEKPS